MNELEYNRLLERMSEKLKNVNTENPIITGAELMQVVISEINKSVERRLYENAGNFFIRFDK